MVILCPISNLHTFRLYLIDSFILFRIFFHYSEKILWNFQASDSPLPLDAGELDLRIKQRLKGENRYLDGETFASASTLSKAVRKS